MRAAVIVVDMLADYLDHELPIAAPARAIVPAIDRLTAAARGAGLPVVFACDAFAPDDFLFGGRMQPHAIAGTPGADPSGLLYREPQDVVLHKPRFSAFFETELQRTLRDSGVEAVAVCGITTHVCVLATVLDAVCHDFHAFFIEDCCAAHKRDVHDSALALYRDNPLFPLLRVMDSGSFLDEFAGQAD